MRERIGDTTARPASRGQKSGGLLEIGNRTWYAFLAFLPLLFVLDRLATVSPLSRHLLGLEFLAAILALGIWAGMVSALASSAVLVGYVWVLYRFPGISPMDQKPEHMVPQVIATAIVYPLFAVIGGVVHSLRRRAVHAEAARADAEQQKDQAIQSLHAGMHDLNSRIEERVAERTRQLQEANEDLLGFTYSMSHDLRAPLRAIVSNSRIASLEAQDALDGVALERLQRLEASALKMEELIESLLQYARIGHLNLAPREVDLSQMAARIGSDLRICREGSLTVEPGLIVRGDPDLLELVLLNLLENAWKYVGPDQHPVVHIGKAKDGAIFVRDQGIGFDMRYVEKIWEPFERLHSGNDYPGTGIGLANAKRIIERHGGSIWSESVPGKGTTMYFRLGAVPETDSLPSGTSSSAPVL